MSVKGDALYALAAYRRLLRGLPSANIVDPTLADAEQAIKDAPDPDVAQGAPVVQGGTSRDDAAVRRRMVKAARRTTKKRSKSRS